MKKKFVSLLLLLLLIFTGCEKEANTVRFEHFSELSGKKVGIQSGTLYDRDLMRAVPDAQIESYTDQNTMMHAACNGRTDVFLLDNAAYAAAIEEGQALQRIPETLVTYDIGMGLSKTRPELLAQMNEFITAQKQDGTLESLERYWIEEFDADTCTLDRSGLTNENGTLTVAIESSFVPCSYLSAGEFVGLDIDFMLRFCREYGYGLKIEPMNYDAIGAALSAGKVDVGANIVINDEHLEDVTISTPYMTLDIYGAYYEADTGSVSFFASVLSSFNKTFVREDRWISFVQGSLITVLLSVASLLLGSLLGFLLYFGFRRRRKIAKKIVSLCITIITDTPTIVLLMIFYFVIFDRSGLDKLPVAILVFALQFCFTVYGLLSESEASIGKGQREAALSQGFTENAAYLQIILPQSMRYFLPSFESEIITLVKETSVVGYIAVTDLTKVSDMIRGRTFEAFFPLIVTAIIYFIIARLIVLSVKLIFRCFIK